MRRPPFSWRSACSVLAGLLLAASIVAYAWMFRGAAPTIATVVVSKGEFVETLELRGEIRPIKSVIVTAPSQAGELQIVHVARGGTPAQAGDVVVQFDVTTLRRTVQEKTAELKQADAEIQQAEAQAAIAAERNQTALVKARYAVDRARLDLGLGELAARLDHERALLSLADAEDQLRETEQKVAGDAAAAGADLASRRLKRAKTADDLARAVRSLDRLTVSAPASGTLHLMMNTRSGGPFGNLQEFRAGDRAWPGAQIGELPDLTGVLMTAQLDEADRGRLRPGLPATVHVDALASRKFRAKVADISLLARVDFSSGFPPVRNFDLRLQLDDVDPALRPGMSATARIAIDRLPDVLRVPSQAVFSDRGQTIVYRRTGSRFAAVPVEVVRRQREQVAISGLLSAGDELATTRPNRTEGDRP
jgi:HlyD family secretion protein